MAVLAEVGTGFARFRIPSVDHREVSPGRQRAIIGGEGDPLPNRYGGGFMVNAKCQ